MAATEFALILPIMVSLYFGALEASEAMTVNRRVTTAANTLVDLIAQTPDDDNDMSPTDLDNLLSGIVAILEPNNTSLTVLQIEVTSLEADADGDAVVHWSRDRSGAGPHTAGSDFTNMDDSSIVDDNGSILHVEITYQHHLAFTHFLGTPVTFRRTAVRWPRNVDKVQFCQTPSTCTT